MFDRSNIDRLAEGLMSFLSKLTALARRSLLVPGRVQSVELRVVELERLTRQVLTASISGDAAARRELRLTRESPAYDQAFAEPEPLVSVIVSTTGLADRLCEIALPSILAQTHPRIEVIVVAEGLGPLVQRRLEQFDDPRLRFYDRGFTLPASAQPRERLARNAMAINDATHMAAGMWFTVCSEEDELHPQAIELLLGSARSQRAEVAYGRLGGHGAEVDEILGIFPPRAGQFDFSTALCHAALKRFEREPLAAELDCSCEDFLVQAMLRGGVRFTMIPKVVVTR